jgi:metal-responsive CopG/Arc/MetJ family transcriptional regulator
MGRPPLHLLRTHISFAPETLDRIDRIVGEKGRSEFVRKAVDQLLDSVEHTEMLKAKQAKRGE